MYGKPIMTLRVDVPREVSLRGKAAVKVAALCLFTAAVVVLILLVVVLNRVILDPLALDDPPRRGDRRGHGSHHATRPCAQR